MADKPIPRESLALISTHWPLITDPMKFVLRYAPAIRGYLQILLCHADDVDEVLQEFLLHVMQRGFSAEQIRRGRFRDYLIAAVRYRAWRYLRRKGSQELRSEVAARLRDDAAPFDADWLAGWRLCLLDRVWQKLEFKERHSPGNWYYSVLRLIAEHPGAKSRVLAERIGADPPMSAAAFRKQLSRARAAFAQILLDEVEKTLDPPTPETVMEELADLGLLEFVRPYLAGRGDAL